MFFIAEDMEESVDENTPQKLSFAFYNSEILFLFLSFEKENSIIPCYVYAPVLVQRFQLFSLGISFLQFEMDDNLVYKNQQLERINQTEKGGYH